MCWKCGNAIQDEVIARGSECSFCHADLHSCRNCLFYAPGSHYDCHETVAEAVREKERSNFCDSFKVKRMWNSVASSAGTDARVSAKKAFDSLFSV